MSDETTLLPCPWCGVDMKLHAINYPLADGKPGWNIWHEDMGEAGKRKCPMEMGCYDTREEAISAWNTRAELGSGTCELDYDRHCSNCGVCVHESAVLVRKKLDGGLWTVVSKPASFCPNCGARIRKAVER